MSKKNLYILWGALFALCAGLGFIPEPSGALRALCTGLAAAFFVPPALLLYFSYRRKDRSCLGLIRNLSALSLGLTGALLAVSFFAALRWPRLGTFLHILLVVVSSPMVCGGYWAVSLFSWACLLLVSIQLLKRLGKEKS